MSVTLFTLFVVDPAPIAGWLTEHGAGHVVRQQSTRVAKGWSMKVALDDPVLADLFRSRWSESLVTPENHLRWIKEGRLR